MTQTHRNIVGIGLLVVVYLCVRLFWAVSAADGGVFTTLSAEAASILLLWSVICVAATMAIRRVSPVRALHELGLLNNGWRGAALVALLTAPMGVAAMMSFRGASLDAILGNALLMPLAEEILFRGFLCGLLVRVAGWSVGTSVAVSALAFGLAHGGFFGAPQTIGGAVIAWLMLRWRSLWPAIVLHCSMNLWWEMTQVYLFRSTFDAMSIAQMVAIGLAVVATLLATPRLLEGNVARPHLV